MNHTNSARVFRVEGGSMPSELRDDADDLHPFAALARRTQQNFEERRDAAASTPDDEEGGKVQTLTAAERRRMFPKPGDPEDEGEAETPAETLARRTEQAFERAPKR